MGYIKQNITVEYPEDLIDCLETLCTQNCASVKCEYCGLYVDVGNRYRCVKTLAHNALRQIESSKCKS